MFYKIQSNRCLGLVSQVTTAFSMILDEYAKYERRQYTFGYYSPNYFSITPWYYAFIRNYMILFNFTVAWSDIVSSRHLSFSTATLAGINCPWTHMDRRFPSVVVHQWPVVLLVEVYQPLSRYHPGRWHIWYIEAVLFNKVKFAVFI